MNDFANICDNKVWFNMRSGLFSFSEKPSGVPSHSPGVRRGVAADVTLGPMPYVSANPKGLRLPLARVFLVQDATHWGCCLSFGHPRVVQPLAGQPRAHGRCPWGI